MGLGQLEYISSGTFSSFNLTWTHFQIIMDVLTRSDCMERTRQVIKRFRSNAYPVLPLSPGQEAEAEFIKSPSRPQSDCISLRKESVPVWPRPMVASFVVSWFLECWRH